jgi:hypothetical protein
MLVGINITEKKRMKQTFESISRHRFLRCNGLPALRLYMETLKIKHSWPRRGSATRRCSIRADKQAAAEAHRKQMESIKDPVQLANAMQQHFLMTEEILALMLERRKLLAAQAPTGSASSGSGSGMQGGGMQGQGMMGHGMGMMQKEMGGMQGSSPQGSGTPGGGRPGGGTMPQGMGGHVR